MKTRDFMMLGVGLIAGYLICNYTKKNGGTSNFGGQLENRPNYGAPLT
jgi:hypothetical protein